MEDVKEIVAALRKADDAYFNSGSPIMTDDEYDNMREYLSNLAPHHPYLSSVGSPIRENPVKLNRPMPSLNQLHTTKDLENWINRYNIDEVAIMDKMDGNSVRLIFDAEEGFKASFSRGDALEGTDITRHINPSLINFPNIREDVIIRAEVEMSDTSHQLLVGEGIIDYKTPLSTVSGTLNRNNMAHESVYSHLEIFAFEVEYGKEFETKEGEIKWLEEKGFKVPYTTTVKLGKDFQLTNEYLSESINTRKKLHDFGMDGIVVYCNDAKRRQELEKDLAAGDNPRGAFKFKTRATDNTADITVTGIEWNISKHGVFKPTVLFEPVMIDGVTISRATGFNAKFIVDNSVGVGTTAKITRSGDVIPYIYEIIKGTSPSLPDVEYEWNATEVDIISKEETKEQIINKLTSFSESMGIDGLREGTITKLYEILDVKNFEDIVLLNDAKLIAAAGPKNADKIHASLKDVLSNVEMATLMGSTTLFGSGVGVRMMKAATNALTDDFTSWTFEKLTKVEGFGEINARKIIDGLEDFSKFYDKVKDHIGLKDGNSNNVGGTSLQGINVCFTGIRDRDLEKYIVSEGGRLQSSVNGKTNILVYKGTNSSKYKKAVQLMESGNDIKLLTVEEFWEDVDR